MPARTLAAAVSVGSAGAKSTKGAHAKATTNLTMWFWGNDDAPGADKWLAAAVKSYEAKNPTIKIKVVTQPVAAVRGSVSPQLGGTNLPLPQGFGVVVVPLKYIGAQEMLGKIDIVMGSFSKTFASNGGFVACKSRAVKEYLRFYSAPATFSNALSPVQAATILKAFDIVDSVEGRVLRLEMITNVIGLRNQLQAAGLEYYGDPSAIVCVKMGSEGLARLVSKRLPELGLVANLVEFPAVPKGQARIRMQVMANHSEKNIADAVRILDTARHQAELELEGINQPAQRAEQVVA